MFTDEMKKVAHRRVLRYMRNGNALPERWVVADGYIRVEFIGGGFEEFIVEPGFGTDKCLAVYVNSEPEGAWAIEEAIV